VALMPGGLWHLEENLTASLGLQPSGEPMVHFSPGCAESYWATRPVRPSDSAAVISVANANVNSTQARLNEWSIWMEP
jgi:hypothetical protein